MADDFDGTGLKTGRTAHARTRLICGAAAAALLTALSAPAALAQEAADTIPQSPQTVPEATEPTVPMGPRSAGAEAPAQAGSAGGLEEIVVTAERRTQSLQNVPIAATVLSANELARRGVTNILDVAQAAPSLAINTVNRSTFINIRGVGLAQSAPTSTSGVAFYIDGQFIPSEGTIGFSFYDIGAIEVLRGPQGTLTGTNSTGGAIYIRTPEPRIGALSGFAEQTIGNFGQLRSVAAVNVPLGSMMALRVAGTHDKRDSFYEQLGTSPREPGNVNFYGVRANLLIEPSDRVAFNLRWEHYDNNTDNIAVNNRSLLEWKAPYINQPGTPDLKPFQLAEDANSFNRQKGDRFNGESRIGLGENVLWRTSLSYQKGTNIDQTDADRTSVPGPGAGVLLSNGSSKTFIGETNLLSTGDAPFQWVLGGFYLDGKSGPGEFSTDLVNRVNFVPAAAVRSIFTIRNETKAGFGQVTFKPSDQFQLLAGARYSKDKQIFERTLIGNVAGQPNGEASSSKVTGKLSANYTPNRDVLLYVSAARGYKAGGVNPTLGQPIFGPEQNTVFESGFKLTVLDRRLRLNGSVFYSDYQDIQFISLLLNPATGRSDPFTQNAASAKGHGGELEVTGQFGGFAFNGGVGYLNNKFGENTCINNGNNRAGTPALCPVGASPGRGNELVRKGTVVPYSPKWTINTGAQYEMEIQEGVTLTPRVQYSYSAAQLTTPFATSSGGFPLGYFTRIPGRSLVDARLTLAFAEGLRLEVFGSNIFDKRYIASQIQDGTGARGGIIFGAPRQYGMRATVRFGDQ